MLAKLQGDGGADDRFLPFGRDGEPAHPNLPFQDGIVQHPLDRGAQRVGKAFVRSHEEMHVRFQPEPAFLADQADRRIGRHAHRHIGQDHADMVGAVADRYLFRVPAGRRAQPHANARAARDRAHDAHEGDRPVHPPLVPMARAEIIDFDRIALRVALARHQDGGVADIMLFDRDDIFQLDRPEAPGLRILPAFMIEQGGKDRVAIHSGDAAPHHATRAVDQRGRLAIADGPEVERLLVAGCVRLAIAVADVSAPFACSQANGPPFSRAGQPLRPDNA